MVVAPLAAVLLVLAILGSRPMIGLTVQMIGDLNIPVSAPAFPEYVRPRANLASVGSQKLLATDPLEQ